MKRLSRQCAPAAAVSLSLAGCNFAPPYVQPALPVQGSYPWQPQTSSASGASVASLAWQDYFRDEDLRRLILAALNNNRDIRTAAARVAEARGTWRIQGAALYPQLDANAAAITGRVPDDFTISLPGGTGTATTSGPDNNQHAVTAQLNAGWEIDFWGRIRNLSEAARQRFFASEEARRAVATGLIAQVANGYLLEREYAKRIVIADQTIATRRESYRIMRRRYEEGYGNNLEAKQAEMLLAQANTARERLIQERGVNHNELERLVGQPVVIPAGPLQLTDREAEAIPVGLPSELLTNRPDIVEAEYKLRATNADIGAARAAFFPNIALTGSAGLASTSLDNLFGGGAGTWLFVPILHLPIFNGGRLKGNLDVARARQVEAVADYERTIQGAFRDVANALVKRKQLLAQVETTREDLAAATERARLAQMRYDVGRSTYLEVLDAQRDLFDRQQRLVELERAYLATAIELYAAVGGGVTRNTPMASAAPLNTPTTANAAQDRRDAP